MKLSIVYKLSLIFIMLVLFSASVVGWLFYSKTTRLLVGHALEDIAGEVQNAGHMLQVLVNTYDEDVLFLANTPPIQGMLRTRSDEVSDMQDKSTYAQWVDRLETIFESQLHRKAKYLSIRYIDKNGQELIHVGRSGSKVIRYTDEQLQNKKNRVYVRKTLELPVGSVYVSEINLNREFGVVTKPHREVLRSATPVYDARSGELTGLVSITTEIGEGLRAIQERVGDNDSQIYITNDRGGYLLHPDESKAYGFDLGKRYRIQDEISSLSKLFLPDNHNHQVTLMPEDTDGQHVVNFTKIPFDSANPERFIAVVITQEHDSIVAEQSQVLNEVSLWTLFLIFGGVGLGVLFSVRISRPIKQITQVMDDYAHQKPSVATLPVWKGDEIGVLARSFNLMVKQVEESQENLRQLNDNLETLVVERTRSLEKSEVQQRTILETIADAIVTTSEDGLIISFNPAAENIFGYRPDEITGQNISILFPEDEQHPHTEIFLLNAPNIISQTRELEGMRKDGSLFPSELNVAPMQGGGQRGFVGILRDITARKHAEQELNRFKTTLDETMDCVFMFEPDSLKFFYVNSGAIAQVGYSFDELMNMTPYEIKPDFDEQRFRETIAPMLAGKQDILNFETMHQHKDGRTIPVEIFLQYINPQDEPARFVAIVRDITERKRIDRMKNEFISTVSHELRTPLTSIRGSLGLIIGGAVGELPEQAQEMLRIAGNNTERLLLLINDILDIQKIESGQMAFKFQSLELMNFIEQAIEENEGYGDQHGVRFVVVKGLADARVYADRDRLMQVMANLLSNAAKFSPEGETVEISIAHHKDAVRISVTDHGTGISENFQGKVFDKFTQYDASDNRQKGGTGLGLNITRIIVEKHGGRIGFVSKEGIGTTFYVDLPELIGECKTTEGNSPRQLTGKDGAACILIVEDDPDVAVLLKRMLAEAGYNADIAYDVPEARQLLKDNRGQYKLLTLDLILPGESGISFLDELRSNDATHDLPVVVVSVTANETKRDLNGSAMNLVDWLQKPIDQDRLIDAIKQAAGSGKRPRILHVEDEADVHKVVSMMLRDYCELTWTTTLAASKEMLETETFDLVLLDIGLPDGSGLDLLEIIEERVRPPRVVIFSAYNVTEKYADKVSAVLVKSKTGNLELAEVVNAVINQG